MDRGRGSVEWKTWLFSTFPDHKLLTKDFEKVWGENYFQNLIILNSSQSHCPDHKVFFPEDFEEIWGENNFQTWLFSTVCIVPITNASTLGEEFMLKEFVIASRLSYVMKQMLMIWIEYNPFLRIASFVELEKTQFVLPSFLSAFAAV